MFEYIINAIVNILGIVVWPICTTILIYIGLSKLSIIVGGIQYKRLAILSDIKDYVYFLTDLIRREQLGNTVLTDTNYENIYKVLVTNSAYDLARFIKQYTTYCGKLKDIKITKSNKKAKNIKEQRKVVTQYIEDVNAIIRAIMADEYFRSREDLQFLSTQATALGTALLAK